METKRTVKFENLLNFLPKFETWVFNEDSVFDIDDVLALYPTKQFKGVIKAEFGEKHSRLLIALGSDEGGKSDINLNIFVNYANPKPNDKRYDVNFIEWNENGCFSVGYAHVHKSGCKLESFMKRFKALVVSAEEKENSINA